MHTIKVKKILIGRGKPKICLPMVGTTLFELINEAKMLTSTCADIIEWRADFYEGVEEISSVTAALREIRQILPESPLLFTFRNKKEGGERFVSEDFYFALNQQIVTTRQVDFVDLELLHDKKKVVKTMTFAQKKGVKVIMSRHDFIKTPPKEAIISSLIQMQKMGADITKIAVMPHSSNDIITLLTATNEMKNLFADRPFVTIAMANLGIISRISGEIFGSAITFGAMEEASAPGQLTVGELHQILTVLHKKMKGTQ